MSMELSECEAAFRKWATSRGHSDRYKPAEVRSTSDAQANAAWEAWQAAWNNRAGQAVSDDSWQYFYKDNACAAHTAGHATCICWHDEGTGPWSEQRHGEEVWDDELEMYPALSWRNRIDRIVASVMDGLLSKQVNADELKESLTAALKGNG